MFALLGALTLGLGALGLVLELSSPKAQGGYVIELGEEGFSPQSLQVRVGERVTFKSSLEDGFWPASNIHPTHELYPEFDSKGPLLKGETWSFVFEQEGVWRFHDHVHPFHTGTIVVSGGQDDIGLGGFEAGDCSDLSSLGLQEQEKCWDLRLYEAFAAGGAEGAMEEFEKLYNSSPAFVAKGCHWYAHRVGEEAYGRVRNGGELDLPGSVVSCSYGFVHGLLEHLFREEQDASKAVALCEELTETHQDTLPRIRLNCFHAIGHGFTDDPPPSELWGNAQGVIQKPLQACATISENALETKECYDGAYNTLVNFMTENQYGLWMDLEDPLGFCKEQLPQHQWSCYYEFSQILDSASGRDITKIAEFTEGIKNRQIAGMIINTAAAGLMQPGIAEADFARYATDCQALGSPLSQDCVRGMVGGLMAHGEPGKEYEKGTAFCAVARLGALEREACYQNLAAKIRDIYPKEKASAVCSGLPSPYANECSNTL